VNDGFVAAADGSALRSVPTEGSDGCLWFGSLFVRRRSDLSIHLPVGLLVLLAASGVIVVMAVGEWVVAVSDLLFGGAVRVVGFSGSRRGRGE